MSAFTVSTGMLELFIGYFWKSAMVSVVQTILQLLNKSFEVMANNRF